MKKIMQLTGGLIGITMLVGSTPANQKSYHSLTRVSGRLTATQIIEVTRVGNKGTRIQIVSDSAHHRVVSINKQCANEVYVSNGTLWVGAEYSIDLESGKAVQY